MSKVVKCYFKRYFKMVIDFHTHAFNDKIAEKAIAKLQSVANVKAYSDGRINAIAETIKSGAIDKAVLLPVATKPSQQKILNDWVKEIHDENENIIPFGSVHPDAEDVFEELYRIKEMGLYGVKLHPDYQDFFIDEERVFPVYEKCAELSLPVIFHAGYDPLSPDVVHAMPEASKRAHEAVPSMTMILAHMGGMKHWEEVSELIAGLDNVYLDTAYTVDFMPTDLFKKIVSKHGADKILFASDFPWHKSEMEKEFIENLDISDEDKKKILGENARKLLKL